MANRTEDDILEEIRGISDERDALRERSKGLWKELGLLRAQEALNAMPDEQRASLLQVVAAQGVDSAERVQ